jgi:branched-chain amino acid transport system permease protein
MDYGQLALVLLTGLQVGAVYALIALGLTLIFGTLGVANFAHGALFMIGAYAGWLISQRYGYAAAFIATPLLLFALGIAMERGLMRLFYRRAHTDQILVTFGLALVLQELARWLFGGTAKPYAPPAWAQIPIHIGIGYYPPWRLVIIGVTLVVVVGLWLVMRFTDFGLVVRAGMRDPETVGLLGVNVPRRFTLVFGIGALLAGVAGAVGGPTTSVNPDVGIAMLVPSFLVVVIGGMGSLAGAALAAVMLGEAISLSVLFYPPLAQIVVYLVAAVVLLWRPRGLLGVAGVMEK